MRRARIATWGPVQERCAEALGIQQSQISRWEKGQSPNIYELSRFARACNITVDHLLGPARSVPWANLTQTRLGMPYLYDAGASQITTTYPLDWSTMAGTDGWYLIDQYTTPYSGPLPYGQINAYGQASFAWVAGSFWHQHQNNNYANGFGQCWGYPGQLGSTVPAGRWFWTVWQL